MENILRLNLSAKKWVKEKLPEKYKLLGGRGLSSRVIADEVPPTCDPLGKHNKLVITCGLLAGTSASSTNRVSVGAKSPLTGGIKESNGGGVTAYNMARLGYRALILEGRAFPGKPQIIVVDKDDVVFEDAGDLWGMGTFSAMEKLTRRFGEKASYTLIGPAGEMKMCLAGIAHTDMEGRPSRYSARGGLGAVMGGKGVKAIVIKGAPEPSLFYGKDEELWNDAFNRLGKSIQTQYVTGEMMPNYGTALTMEQMQGAGGLVVHNFRRGQLDDIDSFGGRKMREVILERGGEGSTSHACMPDCLIRCSNIFADKHGKEINSPMEYETLGFLGTNLLLLNLDDVNKLNHLCNDIGIDTMETGAVLAVAAEEGLIQFGNFQDMEKLLREIATSSPMGRLMGLGAASFAKAYGCTRYAACKGQTIGAYDPRAIKVNGVTYLTSPMGGDHTAGNGMFLPIDHPNPEGKVEESVRCQTTPAWIDSLGLCLFIRAAHLADPSAICDAMKARYGGEWTQEDLNEIGRETLRAEISFNRKAGIPDVSFFPDFMLEEPLPPLNAVWEINEEELKNIWAPLFAADKNSDKG